MPNSPQKTRPELKSWLDQIQQDSWQLELIVSGFVIFLLIGAWQPVMGLEHTLELLMDADTSYFFATIFYYTLRTGYQALLFCLFIHLVLRGLWIAAIGLRYVSGDIDYEALRYQPRFTERLRNRIGSFDNYIERLERYCSVLFSLAFLILFCFISLAVYLLSVTIIQVGIRVLSGGDWMTNGVNLMDTAAGMILVLFGIIYLIDFTTLGFFKRKSLTARPYYYIYRFMGWITLARFYRPLYYNLIDQQFGRRLARLLPVFIVLTLVVVSIQLINHPYFPYYAKDGKVWIDHYNYDDERDTNLTGQTWRTTLSSKYPANNYIEVFRPYRPRYDDEVIRHKFPALEVSRYKGIKLSGAFSAGKRFNYEVSYDSLLMAISSIQELYLNDSLRTDIKPRFHYHEQRQQPGLLYLLPTHELAVGEHYVKVRFQQMSSDTLRWIGNSGIYFYK